MNTHLKQLWAAMKLPENFKKSYKFFCLGLDIRVTQIVKANVLKAIFLKYLLMFFRNIIRAVRLAVFEIEFNIFFTKKLSIFYFISF